MIALQMTELPGNDRQGTLPQTGTHGERDVTQTNTL